MSVGDDILIIKCLVGSVAAYIIQKKEKQHQNQPKAQIAFLRAIKLPFPLNRLPTKSYLL